MKRIFQVSLALLLFFSPVVGGKCWARASSSQRYADAHRAMADALSKEFGIPREVIIGVAILESSAGRARNCQDLKNHFGIVGRNSVARRTRYKQYGSEQESFRDFCRVISRKSFYPRLRGNPNPLAWAEAISKAGYSEQPLVWRKKVTTLMDSHRL